MKNPLIAERLKFYRKKNNLTIPQVSELLSQTQPVAVKTFTDGKAVIPSPTLTH